MSYDDRKNIGASIADKEAARRRVMSRTPLGRAGEPEEIAATVLHLAAGESAFIVGTEIVIDGGMSQL